MKLLSFTGKGQEYYRMPVPKNAWTYGVEVWTDNDDTGNRGNFGKRYYSWAMPVYNDEGGDYISFERTHLKGILGKVYIKDIAVVEVEGRACKGAREVIPHVVR